MELTKNLFRQWKKTTTDRQKLQHTYLITAILLLLFGGCSALIDREFGLSVAQIAVILFFIFIINTVVYRVITLPVAEISQKTPRRNK